MGNEPPPSPALAHRQWLDQEATDPAPQPERETTALCNAISDDGAECQRERHNDPNHDFAVQEGNPVDGGQKWQHWIHLVHAARAILLDQPATPDQPYRTGVINGPDDTRKLAQLVGLLGLIPADQHPDGSVTIREP